MDLLDLLKRPEGKTLEFKRDLSSPDGALKTIVAFANTAGGTLLIGVEDRSRNVRGVSDPLDEEARLANLISDRISPRLVPEIEILPWRQTQVLALQVQQRRFDRSDRMDGGAQVKGLQAAPPGIAVGEAGTNVLQDGLQIAHSAPFDQRARVLQGLADLLAAGHLTQAGVAGGIRSDHQVAGEERRVRTRQIEQHAVAAGDGNDLQLGDTRGGRQGHGGFLSRQ
jgi:hypothetical protein